MKGTGSILPIMEIITACCHGTSHFITPKGIAPLSSIIGTIEMRNVIK
jgi:hypothetical protein